MERELELEAGIPAAEGVAGEGDVISGVPPAGRYASLSYFGTYEGDGLMKANQALQEWAEQQGLRFAMTETAEGDRFESRLEIYVTDPGAEPDPDKWETEVAYLLADA